MTQITLAAEIEQWPLAAPFRISGRIFELIDVLVVSLEQNGSVGRGEAAGVFYKNDTPSRMLSQISALRATIEGGITREAVQKMLPPGGARNALDCALWDLEAKVSHCPVWKRAELEPPRRLKTTFTCGADTPAKMAATARAYRDAQAIKLKLTEELIDADRVRAVREALSDVWLAVDANQGFTPASLERLLPVLVDMKVALIEQPFPIGEDALLDGFHSPIPIAADESLQTLSDLRGLVGRFNIVNIKLDKCGGLTEGIAIARASRALGLETMVGNMFGTSLAMAPAYLLGQLCAVVDLDGPVFLTSDRNNPVSYAEGFIQCPDALWGDA
jgi:L-alanine-DL-glutamate epimerase-like enolase superfamily enzyme